MKFTPPVVPETQVDPVRFEATVTGSPGSVVFNYNGTDRPMYDDGTHGDVTAGDGVWTITFTPNEILSLNTPARVFRPFIGQCRIPGLSVNVFAEVWTSAMGLQAVRRVPGTGQETDYVVNYGATSAQLLAFDARPFSSQFYNTHPDHFDFLDYVLVGGRRGNRNHSQVKNAVQGIGSPIFDTTSQFGSAGRLQGVTIFPISYFFDEGAPTFDHETGHQWINYLSATPYASGIPHWPKGNVAINVMGFSIGGTGGEGGTFGYTFTPNGSGGYVVGNDLAINHSTFNTMELYLMGLAAPAEVAPYFVLNDPSETLMVGQTLQPSEITTISLSSVVAAEGARVPESANAQKTFRSATIVISDQPLDSYAMSFYDYFARRAESKQQLTYASGFETGTTNPWYLATSSRSVMFSKIADEDPVVSIFRAPGVVKLVFLARAGIHYQPQSSADLHSWIDDGPPFDATTDGNVSIPVSVPSGSTRRYYRLTLTY